MLGLFSYGRNHQPRKEVNILVFPDLDSANTSYGLLRHLGGAETIGPILMGVSKPVQLPHPQSDDGDILNMNEIVPSRHAAAGSSSS